MLTAFVKGKGLIHLRGNCPSTSVGYYICLVGKYKEPVYMQFNDYKYYRLDNEIPVFKKEETLPHPVDAISD